MLVLLAWEAQQLNDPDRTDYYLMALRGTWIKDWDGDLDSLRIKFGLHDPQAQPGSRKLGEVPEGWQPPTKEEIAKAMGKGSGFSKLLTNRSPRME